MGLNSAATAPVKMLYNRLIVVFVWVQWSVGIAWVTDETGLTSCEITKDFTLIAGK